MNDSGAEQFSDAIEVSIVIPTLNESERIETLVSALIQFSNAECIVADGGSQDGTQNALQECAEKFPRCRWIPTERGRARQMNAGAKIARGEWLIFLHADTELPSRSYEDFLRQRNAITCGAFTFRVAHERKAYRYLEWYVRQRCRLLKLPFGDQAIFARRDLFERLGGYREDFPLMEDMEFAQRINKDNGFKILESPVLTSARRYEEEGYWKRATGNIALQVLYRAGVHPKRLADWYYK